MEKISYADQDDSFELHSGSNKMRTLKKSIITKYLLAHVSLQRTSLRCQRIFPTFWKCPCHKDFWLLAYPFLNSLDHGVVFCKPHALLQVTLSEALAPLSLREIFFPILFLGCAVNFRQKDIFSKEGFNHNALIHTPRYLPFARHSSNSQTERCPMPLA
ncbi:hypothetical protein AVEN_82619-1 [Araneus ventricosus]|uniref:Uncharacterized protein n=1 Tax=Araneus ventricosus TaxID=182803 RepID=A0A4Y2MQA8_ARAVE|nr:hypothetical protein AVEN_82619-1 [Araneus ventricosus]